MELEALEAIYMEDYVLLVLLFSCSRSSHWLLLLALSLATAGT